MHNRESESGAQKMFITSTYKRGQSPLRVGGKREMKKERGGGECTEKRKEFLVSSSLQRERERESRASCLANLSDGTDLL
jgi:hypothetical protein